jgi:bifunctional UDP-N-acetylglucosamine pyrophosphorylase/glucosamine-1-phosphate N-acetyltransferase
MRGAVLAAGEGSRMWPLAESKPKHLLPVGGKPILSHILEALRQNSIREVYMVVGYRAEDIRAAFGDGAKHGLHIEYLDQPKWTGTASALKVAYNAVGREPFLAIYGDLWVNSSAVQAVIEEADNCPRVMGVAQVPNPTEFGVVELAGDRLASINEKPAGKMLTEGWVNTGIYVLDGEVFNAIDKTAASKRAEYELTASLQQLLEEGKEIRSAIVDREDWMDVGRPWDLLEANERSLENLSHRVKGAVEQGAVLKGPVWLEENSVVKSGSYLEGPVYVGRSSRIGPNARIRPSTAIGDGVTIGTSCEIKNSVVMNGTKIPHLSYVGDSVIGEDCNLGAGTITANIRFDERPLRMRVKGRMQETGRRKIGTIMGDRVQTGINTSILPGVRIGSDSWIGPGLVLTKDVPSKRTVLAKQVTTIKPRRH